MEQANPPSPYFIRRAAPDEKAVIDLQNFSVVEDQVHPLKDYWRIVKRHRWLILSCALVIFVGAALYTFTRTPLYTSEATLLIERKAPQFLKLQDARGDADDYNQEFYKTQYEILKSRALAERVIRTENLAGHPVFGGGQTNQAGKEGLVSGLWQQLKAAARDWLPGKPAAPDTRDSIPLSARLAERYRSMLEVRPIAGTSLVVIKITTPDPALSARLANAHASSYVRYGDDLRSRTNSDASEFLQQKLTELKERVEQSEAALNSYRKAKGIISVDDKSNVIIERLLDLNKGLTAAEGERIAWEAQLRAARGRNAEEVPAVRNSQVIGALKAELAKLEGEHASLAKEFKPGYPPLENVKARMEETRRRLSAEIDREIKSIEAGYAAARNKESNLRSAMDEQKNTTLNLKDSAVQYAILAREVETNKQLYDGVLSRLKEIGVAADGRSSNIHVMGKALPPGFPSYPDKRRTLLLGLIMGLAAGIALAFLLEQLDNSFKSPEEAERYLRLPNLAVVPDFSLLNGGGHGYLSRLLKSAKTKGPAPSNGSHKEIILGHHPLSLVTEAYRSLRSSLLLSQAGGAPRTVLITSAVPEEGKTTTLINAAVVFAQMGCRVLVIDADLRRPRCHMFLKTENLSGLAELVAGQIDLQAAIKPTQAENLFLISSGAIPPNPAELLGSRKMHEILQQLRNQFEFIFIDSSPVMAVSDTIFLSTMVDGALLVVNRQTPKSLVRKARARLAMAHTKILGILLNRVDTRAGDYGNYYAHYYEYYPRGPDAENGTEFSGNGHPRRSGKSRANGKSSAPSEAPAIQRFEDGNASISLDRLRAELAAAMGPMAALVVRDHVNALGESADSFPAKRFAELVKRVSREIFSESVRRTFEEEMLGKLQKVSAPPTDL